MWSVQTSSRLHFGLLSLPSQAASSAALPLAPRRFGGVGLMIDRPGIKLSSEAASSWTAEGPLAARALAYAEQLQQTLLRDYPSLTLSPRRLLIDHAPPEHVGLGVGTQLGLAVARVLTASWGIEEGAAELARRVGRGKRSALGVHGFTQGGFMVEAGKRLDHELSPLVARIDFPSPWRVLFVVPPGGDGLHGSAEQAAFAALSEPKGWSEGLCRLVLLGLLPSLAEADFAAFAEALFEFNARVGEAFASVQGGIYTPAARQTVAALRRQGLTGVGQSSWGPGVFAIVADEDQATHLAETVRSWPGYDNAFICVTPASNHGAELTMGVPAEGA